MKKNTVIIYCLVVFAMLSCEKEDVNINGDTTACGVENPVKNIAWINSEYLKIKDEPKLNGIVLYQYNGQDIIEIQSGFFSSTNQHQYYCDGTKINFDDPTVFNKYKSERKEISVLFGTKF